MALCLICFISISFTEFIWCFILKLTYFAKLIRVRQLLLIFISAGLIFASGCEKSGTKKEFKLDQYFRDYFYFREGSTWTYQLAGDTNVKEHVTVKNQREGVMGWEDIEQEFFTYELVSDYDSQQIVRAVATDYSTGRWALLYKDTAYRQVAELYYNSNQISGVQGNNDTVNFLSTMSVGDVTYNDVVELRSSRRKVVKTLYYSKKVGIIRRDYVDGRVFLLKSYQLN